MKSISLILLTTALSHPHIRTQHSFGPEIPMKFHSAAHSDAVVFAAASSRPMSTEQAVEIGIKQASALFAVDGLVVSSKYTSWNGITHVYLQQTVDGVNVVNGVGSVNVDRYGAVSSISGNFFTGSRVSVAQVPISAADAVRAFGASMRRDLGAMQMTAVDSLTGHSHFLVHGPTIGEVPCRLVYMQTPDGLQLVWDIEVEMLDSFWHAHVDALSGRVIGQVDWVSDASYNVLPLGVNDPTQGDRVLVKDPSHPLSSPRGWHNDRGKNYTATVGNNVFAQNNPGGDSEWRDNYRPDGGKDLVFDFPLDFKQEPASYVDAAITNLFYWCNIIHDLFYVYGFTEPAGNFQQFNYGRGGRGSDFVIANAQDGSGYNNANFMTPPDGRHGKMRMYIWSGSSPMRDGDLESGIIVHGWFELTTEYAHGISTRLTGGPANSGCLGWGESGGMGEGWGDFFATIFQHTEKTTRSQAWAMGKYANGGSGIRKYLYSSDMSVNPSTYGFINKPGYWGVHAKGEVWAMILIEVYWELVQELGFDSDWFNVPGSNHTSYINLATLGKHPRKPKKGLAGNIVALQLVVDGLKLQPCYPTFVDARDAILEADYVGFGGRFACSIWRGFAKRGLGKGARGGGHESFELPRKCRNDELRK